MSSARDLYLDLLKRSVGDFIYDTDKNQAENLKRNQLTYVDLRTGQKHYIRSYEEMKENGLTSSNTAFTIIGMKRLNHLQEAVETILKEDIPGDFIETGVLRGGACIFMRGVLKAYTCTDRRVWVADSFAGFPEEGLLAWGIEDPAAFNTLAASLETVKENFSRYQLLDDQVRFLSGWFKDTLPSAPIEQLALIRLDGDMYSSTMESISALYPKLSSGGYLIVDDYYAFKECRQAIRDYRKEHGIIEPIERVDPVCVYWRKA